MPAPIPGMRTSLEKISSKAVAFYQKINQIATFLKDNDAPAELQINPDEFFLEFYIDKAALARLHAISALPGCEQLGVYFGLQNPDDQQPLADDAKIFGQLTACFIGVNENRNVVGGHFEKIPVGQSVAVKTDGEDTWPPPPPPGANTARRTGQAVPLNYLRLADSSTTVEEFFKTDGSNKP